jgi:hypothetical protein
VASLEGWSITTMLRPQKWLDYAVLSHFSASCAQSWVSHQSERA